MTEQETADVVEIVERYSGDRGMLIPMMQDIQTECGYLPQAELRDLSRRLSVPLAQLYSVATFYASFRLMPKGEHTVSLCMGTVCFLKGAEKISDAIRKEFELVPGGTSPDGKFTFSPVNCVGACALAPVMVVDGEYHGGLTADSAVELLHKTAAGGNGGAGGGEAGEEEADGPAGSEAAEPVAAGKPGAAKGPRRRTPGKKTGKKKKKQKRRGKKK
jgi:NADH-quinone oxidoreductase subunit E